MKKTLWSICLVSVLGFLLAISGMVFAKNFSDLSKSYWAYDTIQLMEQKGYLNGYEDGSFRPEKKVSREEFMQMLYNVTGMPKATQETIQNYYDVKEDRWSYNAVQVYGHYLKETSDGYIYLYPSRPIQRQEVAQLLNGVFELDAQVDGLTTNELKEKFVLNDASSINSQYEEAVYNTYYTGLMMGMPNSEFSPETSLTRAQAATLLARIIKLEEPVEDPEMEKKDLDVDFFRLENAKKNLLYSPFSIRYALTMLKDGARGNTEAQIEPLVVGSVLTNYKNSENLSLANSFFIKNTIKDEVKDSYIATLKNTYNAEIVFDDFASAKPANDWIEKNTLGLLKNVLQDDTVTQSISLLINAIAMDMEWDAQFSEENTHGRTFYKADGSDYIATTMNQKVTAYDGETTSNAFGYYKDDDIQILVKDLKEYDNAQFEFVAIMPRTRTLSDFVDSLTAEEITSLRNKAQAIKDITYRKNVDTIINLYIPKFKFEYELKFKKDLMSLGMTDAFDEDLADFFNMYKENDIGENYYVSDAIHKAMIDFSEEGIKAAAVTVFAMAKSTAFMPKEREYIDIVFDHPFFFVIRDKKTGNNLFVGTVYEPNHWDNDKVDYEMKF